MTSDLNNKKDISRHILPTSSNLLGICFVILNFIKLWKAGRMERIVIDKLVGVSIVLFLIASILSYMSMRSVRKAESYEKSADIIFLIGLSFLALVSVITAFEIL